MSMCKTKMAVLFAGMSMLGQAWALQPLADNDMARATGQDGLTVSLQWEDAAIGFDGFMLTDKGGKDAPYNNNASLIYVPVNEKRAISFYKNSSLTTPQASDKQVIITMDSDGNNGKPVENIHIALPDIQRIRIDPFYLGLASDLVTGALTNRDATGTLANSATHPKGINGAARPMLYSGADGIDIVVKSDNPLAINLQLGNSPQGGLFRVSSGALTCIANGGLCGVAAGLENYELNPLEVYSYNGATLDSGSIKLGFKLTATSATTGFRLHGAGAYSGIYGGIADQGLFIAADGEMDKFDLTIGGLTMGTKGNASTTFDGLKNASIGNIGLKGVAVTDFKAVIKGM